MLETGEDPRVAHSYIFKDKFKKAIVPEKEVWRIPLLSRLLEERQEKEIMEEDSSIVEELIGSLCSS